MPEPCFIFDLDGTLFDCTHRLHFIQNTPKDWDAFFEACGDDPPIPHMVDVLMAIAGWHFVIYVTGRRDSCRWRTTNAMRTHKFPTGPLFMRADNDFRDDAVVKMEILEDIRSKGYAPLMAFDDRAKVVQAWRAAGVPCAQVADGDY